MRGVAFSLEFNLKLFVEIIRGMHISTASGVVFVELRENRNSVRRRHLLYLD